MTEQSDFAGWLAAFMAEERLPAEFAETVETIWRPLAARIANAAHGRPAFVAGVCGTQASGKSTAVAVIERLLQDDGLTVAVLSIDDLYLTRAQRQTLAEQVHPLFATRGPPGTHDIGLALRLLDALARPGEVALPRFDKAADDRRPEAQWDQIAAPVDVVLFEGWCVGALPQPAGELARPINRLERERDPDGVWRTYANDQLAGSYGTLFRRIDRLVLIQAPDFDTVLDWRREQERKLRERLARDGAGPGRAMSDAEVETFIAHYERLTRHILAEMPSRADEVVRLDARRRPLTP